MTDDPRARAAAEVVRSCHAKHNPWPLTGKPYACVECIADAVAQALEKHHCEGCEHEH